MAIDMGGTPPAALQPNVIKKLLDLLSTDDDFRSLFEKDADAALIEAGYTPPADADLKSAGSVDSARSSGVCLQLDQGATLASKEKIAEERAKLEASLNAIHGFMCPAELQDR